MNDIQKAKYLIENNHHIIISTADASAKPWISPVFFMYDDDYNLYWVSSKDAKHSKNIRENKRAAIVIMGTTPDNQLDGVYFDAIATEIEDESEINNAIKIMQKRKQAEKFMIKSISDVTGKAIWRMYKATPREISKRADAVDSSSNQVITIRKKIIL